jgi:hypothetical protein
MKPTAPLIAPYKLADLFTAIERFGVWGVGRGTVNLTIFADEPGLTYAIADQNPIGKGKRRAAHEWLSPKFGLSWPTYLTTAELAFVATAGQLYVCDACKPLFALVAEVHKLNQHIRRLPFPGRRPRRAAVMAERDEVLAQVAKERYVAQRTCKKGRPEQTLVWGSKKGSTDCSTVPSGTVIPAKVSVMKTAARRPTSSHATAADI